METKWLEDFVSLVETRSFSRSAQLRHVTQPAFSRRIQSLEAWAGADLVDRSSYPMRLTPAGETLYPQALEMLQALQGTRALQGLQHLQCLGVQGFTRRREAHGVGRTVHQVGPSPGLQRLNPPGKRRLRDVAQLRRATETACFHQTDEVFQPLGFHEGLQAASLTATQWHAFWRWQPSDRGL